MKTVTVDGRKIEVADDVAAVIEALQAETIKQGDTLAEVAKVMPAATQLMADLRAELAAKDKILADALAEVEDTKKKIPTATDLAKMAKDRADLIDAAKKIVPDIEIGDQDAAGIRALVVSKKMGDAAVKDRSGDYVSAMFDALASVASDADTDPIRDAMKAGGTGKTVSPRDAYIASLNAASKQ